MRLIKINYSILLAIFLLSGCTETDTSGGDNTQTEERTTQQETHATANSTGTTEVSQNERETTTTRNEPETTEASQTEEVANKSPIANAGVDMSVTVNESVTITGSASDSDGTISTIEWKKGNEVLATTLSFEYIATEVGTDTLTLTVTDDDGATASDSVTITVKEETSSNSDFGGKK